MAAADAYQVVVVDASDKGAAAAEVVSTLPAVEAVVIYEEEKTAGDGRGGAADAYEVVVMDVCGEVVVDECDSEADAYDE